MSLEQALAANTAAMIELREAILAFHARQLGAEYALNVVDIPTITVTEEPAQLEAPAPAPERKRGRVKPEIRDVEVPFEVAPAPAPTPEPQPVVVTYQEAASAITKLAAAKGRPAAAAVLAEFGVAKLPEAKADQYAAIKAAAEAALQ